MTRIDLPYVRIVNPARGGVYYYFDTGKRNAKGKAIIEKVRRKALTKNGGANEEPELPMNLPPVDRPKKPVDR